MAKEKKNEGKLRSDKLVYRLEEISRIAKVSPHTIESWEKEFYFVCHIDFIKHTERTD